MKSLKSELAVEYTDCIYVVGYVPHNECPVYDTKQSYGKAPVLLELWGKWKSLHSHCSQVHFGLEL